jgi:hypothetical protein
MLVKVNYLAVLAAGTTAFDMVSNHQEFTLWVP